MKRTTPELAEFIADLLGTPESVERSRLRRLREDGMISQKGHGKGAAAATANDAALLLLVSLLGVPPLYTVLIGEGVLACTIGLDNDSCDADGPIKAVAGDAVSHVAALIASGGDVESIYVSLQGDSLHVSVSAGERSIGYQMPVGDPAGRKLAAKFGQPGKVERTHRGRIRDGVLPELTKFLGLGAESAA